MVKELLLQKARKDVHDLLEIVMEMKDQKLETFIKYPATFVQPLIEMIKDPPAEWKENACGESHETELEVCLEFLAFQRRMQADYNATVNEAARKHVSKIKEEIFDDLDDLGDIGQLIRNILRS